MADKLAGFYRGDTKRWRVQWPTDIAGATLLFTLAHTLGGDPVLQIQATLDPPDAAGAVFGGFLEISAAASGLLTPGVYFCDHQLTLASGEVGTFCAQRISVLVDVTR